MTVPAPAPIATDMTPRTPDPERADRPASPAQTSPPRTPTWMRAMLTASSGSTSPEHERERLFERLHERRPLLGGRRGTSSSDGSFVLPPRRGSRGSGRRGSRGSGRRGRRAPPIYLYPAIFLFVLFLLALFAAWDLTIGECRVKWMCDVLGGRQESWESVWGRTAGAYAPWKSMGAAPLPAGCRVDQVSILHRHTGRYPTPHAGEALRRTLGKIANRGIRVPTNRPEFNFLSHTDMNLTDWDFGQLTAQGRRAAWESGRSFAAQYDGLELFVRTTDLDRVQETSRFWLAGFAGSEFGAAPKSKARANLTIPEGKHVNNTLSVHSCAAFENLSPPAGAREYARIVRQLQPAAERLNGILDPQPPLDADDVVRIASMCGFDTTARGGTNPKDWGWSRWCRLLTRSEWEIAGYVMDVERWYRVGDGGRFGKIMGAGYVNELLARLGDTGVVDETTVNHTLDDNEDTFPKGGNRMFVDFTHDNEMIEIMTAVGLRRLRTKMPVNHLPAPRDDANSPDKDAGQEHRFVLAHLVPFGARWAFERVVCPAKLADPGGGGGSDGDDDDGDGDEDGDGEDDVGNDHTIGGISDAGDIGVAYPTKPRKPRTPKKPAKEKTYVRVLLNDKPTHVDHMACRSSPHHAQFLCELPAFVESQIWSRDDVDWRDCQATVGQQVWV